MDSAAELGGRASKNPKMRLLSILMAVELLIGCTSDPYALNEQSLTRDINDHLALSPPCLDVDTTFLAATDDEQDNLSKYNALSKVGFVRPVASSTNTYDQLTHNFEMTPSGKENAGRGCDLMSAFPYAVERVDKIIDWTEPYGAGQVVHVSYTYQVISVAAWAQNTTMRAAFSGIDNELSGQRKDRRTIELSKTHNGWSADPPR
jgi:hypothetical protein